MNQNNNLILNRIFSKNIFKELLETQNNDTYITSVKRYLSYNKSKTNQELISEIYNVMSKQYRNEYFYKNTILNKLLLGRHSISTTTALTEIPIAKSKADFILINGKAIVYEIKTDLDNFERLDSQLDDYYKAFSNVCVVTCESNYETILKKVNNSSVGICILTDRNTLSTKKEPIEDKSNLDLNIMFKILRKNEYEIIIKECYGELPQVSQFSYYRTCCKLFCDLGVETAYKFMIKELKKRNKVDKVEYLKVPYELKFLIYFSKYRKEDYIKLDNFLKNTFRG